MAIQRFPRGNQDYFDLVRAFKPTGSETTVAVADVTDPYRKRLVRLVKWGNDFYLPTYVGMKYAIIINNGADRWMAYPSYFGGNPVYHGAPQDPELCTPDQMWELAPGKEMFISHLMQGQNGREFVVTEVGQGVTIAEATHGNSDLAGDIVVYERKQIGSGYAYSRDINEGMTLSGPAPLSSSAGTGKVFRGGGAKGASPRHGTGAGKQKEVSNYGTGIHYQRAAQPVIFIQMEAREDMRNFMNRVMGYGWTWDEPWPTNRWWWESPWSWSTSNENPVAPEIPMPGGHDPRHRRTRRGGGWR